VERLFDMEGKYFCCVVSCFSLARILKTDGEQTAQNNITPQSQAMQKSKKTDRQK
jgi:hypothetical protein